jgi:alpha-glucosidase
MLALYRNALTLRRHHLGDGTLTWRESQPGVLAFNRESLTNITNLSAEPIDLPPHQELLLTSSPLDNGQLPPDTTAWLR